MKDLQRLARELGGRGGRARAARLSPARRRQIASQGGLAKALSRVAADRVRDNFRYLEAVDALQGRRPETSRGR